MSTYKNNKDINIMIKNLGLSHLKPIGHGNHGKIYRLCDDRILKLCRDSESCIQEVFILLRVDGSPYFPKIYDFDENYIVREYISGHDFRKYLKHKPLNKKLCENLLDIIYEFTRLGFIKIDIRLRDLIITDDKKLKIIDPKQFFTRSMPFPRHLLKGLKKYGYDTTFLKYVKSRDRNLYELWFRYMDV